MTNCPNCGAPIRGYECEYCGTVFDNTRLEIHLLKQEMAKLMQINWSEELYRNAIKAMRNYAGGI